MTTEQSGRIKYLDALRGFAVIMMLQQHLGVWLWNAPFSNIPLMIREHPLFMAFNAAGGIAAPVFITLSGTGAFFLMQSSGFRNMIFFKRGALLVLSGYLLNLLTPSWFSPGSWYVLHLIGFALICAPLFRMMGPRALLFLLFLILAVSVGLQIYLNTPLKIGNERMGNYLMGGGVFRLIFAEGHFPVFPWLAYFLSGMITGRWLFENRRKRILYYSVILCALCFFLHAFYLAGLRQAVSGPYIRIFRYSPGFYPSHLPISFLLIGLSSLLVFFSFYIDRIKSDIVKNVLVSLGRSSLSILFVHVVLFKELTNRLGFYRTLPEAEGVMLILSLISVIALLSYLWRGSGYRYGMEWLLRRLS